MSKEKQNNVKPTQVILPLLRTYSVSEAGNLSSGQCVVTTDVTPGQDEPGLESTQRSDLQRRLVMSSEDL